MKTIVSRGRFHRGPYAWQLWQITREESGAFYRLTISGEFYASGESRRDLIDEVLDLDGFTN